MELLQIATAQFITKCDGQLLQIATAFLLQSTTRFITNCDGYYQVRWIYYKLRQVLQSALIITNCDSTKAFFRSGIWLKIFFWPILAKKKVGKMAIFGPKPRVFSFCFFFLTFPTSYFYSLERRFFALYYRKRNFLFLYCRKTKLEKWPLLDQNHGKNVKITKTFGKITIFRLFELLVFIAQKGVFFSRKS